MGVFKDWQPRYLAEGIATFPVAFVKTAEGKIDKKPLISGYTKIGTNQSSRLAARSSFADCNGIGFCPTRAYGPKLTVLDVDIADAREVEKAIERHGDTPIIVKTASGKYHLYYRHNGEPRRIRPGGNTIDLLGAGFVAAPPSISNGGSYEFIRGGLSDICNLPVMRGVDALLKRDGVGETLTKAGESERATRQQTFSEGERNKMLFRACMMRAKRADSFDEVLAYARDFNMASLQPSLLDMEVVDTATSAWKYQVRGENFIGGGGGGLVTCPTAMVDDLAHDNPDALSLMMVIRRNHWDRERFCLANAMAQGMGWTLPRFKAARRLLVDRGYLRMLRPATNKAPSEYGWPQRRRIR